ncbi:hypothetical protein [Entomobacter blattae]|uniref:Lipoprotein n=1 Tax=Entomobacter blattae TaxID=2762277 RepID=A0A7H1NRP4_9PROT|nr:hypothetical protein [Entomobacter blattae]QNT77564.1 hypothetical protein JGUZn3_03070 [Entomobacter blattae]QNT78454.1 hypothetical protein JGUZn3_12280 [Entomobacter blattae]
MNPFFCPKYFYTFPWALPLLITLAACGKTLPPEPDFDGDVAVNRTVPDEISPYMPQIHAGNPIVLAPPVEHRKIERKHKKISAVSNRNNFNNNRNNNPEINTVISTPLPAPDQTAQALIPKPVQPSEQPSVVVRQETSPSNTEVLIKQAVENKIPAPAVSASLTPPLTLNFSGEDIHEILN